MFTDRQKFKTVWVWVLMLALNALMGYYLVIQLIYGIPAGDHPAPDFVLIIFSAIPFTLLILFKIMYLETTITAEKVSVHYFPFLKLQIPMQEIDSITVVEYSPMLDYGGWGIRYGDKGKAYIINGNKGLSLELTNSTNILIGINDNSDLNDINLKQYGKNQVAEKSR